MSATTCTNHCSACGRHFHSLGAFDAHRIGDFASNDPETRRRCQSPYEIVNDRGEPRLEALTASGVCALGTERESGVTIWTMRGAREKGAHLRAMAEIGYYRGRR